MIRVQFPLNPFHLDRAHLVFGVLADRVQGGIREQKGCRLLGLRSGLPVGLPDRGRVPGATPENEGFRFPAGQNKHSCNPALTRGIPKPTKNSLISDFVL